MPKSKINGTTPPLTLSGFMGFIGTTSTFYYSLLSWHFCWQMRLNQHIPPWELDVLYVQVNLSWKTISFVSSSHPLLLFIYPVGSLSHTVTPYPFNLLCTSILSSNLFGKYHSKHPIYRRWATKNISHERQHVIWTFCPRSAFPVSESIHQTLFYIWNNINNFELIHRNCC